MFCKKRKARKAAKNSAVVAAMAMAEKADDLHIPGHADMFAEKLTGKKKAMKKARKATSKTARKAQKELERIKRNGGKRPRKGLALVGLVLALGIGGFAAYKAARPVKDPWKSA